MRGLALLALDMGTRVIPGYVSRFNVDNWATFW
jgi:hypothetical protein